MKKLYVIILILTGFSATGGWSANAQTRIAAGKYGFSLVACPNGSIESTGWNHYGQLGDGTVINRNSPVQVTSLTGVIAVDGGDTHSLAPKPLYVSRPWRACSANTRLAAAARDFPAARAQPPHATAPLPDATARPKQRDPLPVRRTGTIPEARHP